MKKYLAFALIFSLLSFAACKKSEEQQNSQNSTSSQKGNPDKAFKPQGGRNRQEQPGTLKVDLYTDKNLVKSITPEDIPALTSTKIKAGAKEVLGIQLKDLLAKQNMKGKNVALVGESYTANLTWDQVNSNNIYLIMTPKKRLKLFTDSKNLADVKLPKKLNKITVGDTPQQQPETKPAT